MIATAPTTRHPACYAAAMTRGNLIVLNGTSSSGKTSIARALQARWSEPLLYLALDTAIGIMPFQYTGAGTMASAGYSLSQRVDDSGKIVDYSVGLHGKTLNKHLASFAASLCADGYDVVLDHVIVDDETMIDLAACLSSERVYFVAVHCDRSIAEMREKARGDRILGLVAGQLNKVHAGLREYDLSVDSSRATPNDLANMIIRFVEGGSPSAMARIKGRLATQTPNAADSGR